MAPLPKSPGTARGEQRVIHSEDDAPGSAVLPVALHGAMTPGEQILPFMPRLPLLVLVCARIFI